MLTAIRSKLGSIVVKALAGLLILSFAAWGIEDMITVRFGEDPAAEVGNVEISPYAVQNQVRREMARLNPLFGGRLTTEQARAFGLIDGVLQRQIDTTLLDLGAQDLGVTIGDGLINQAIRTSPSFRGLAGAFDRQRFYSLLQGQGLSEAAYVEQVRGELRTAQYLNTLQDGAAAPKTLVDATYRHRNQKRTVETVTVTDAAAGDVSSGSDAQLREFHKNNAERFTAPETRKLTFVWLKAADLAAEIAVTEEQLLEAYEARADQYNVPEKRRVLQMILKDEETAKQAAAKIAEGQTFVAVAKDVAGQDEAALDLGLLTEGDLLPELSKTAFELAKDQVSAPLSSSLGWHLLMVPEIEPGTTKTLEQVRGDVRNAVAMEKSIDALFDLSNRLEDTLGSGANLEEAASKLNLKAVTIGAVDATGNDAAGKSVAGLPVGPAFLETAFQTEQGEESSLTELGDDGFFIVRVDGVTEAKLRPFETIQADVDAAWRENARRDAAEAMAKSIVERLKAGGDLADVAKEMNLEIKSPDSFSRISNSKGVPQDMIDDIFKLTIGQAAVGRGNDGFVVAKLTAITEADPVAGVEDVKDISEEMLNAVRGDIAVQLTEALRQEHGVTVNRHVVDQIFNADQSGYPGHAGSY